MAISSSAVADPADVTPRLRFSPLNTWLLMFPGCVLAVNEHAPRRAAWPRCSDCAPGARLSVGRRRAKELGALCRVAPLAGELLCSSSVLTQQHSAPRDADGCWRVIFSSVGVGPSLPKVPCTAQQHSPARGSASAAGISPAEVQDVVPVAFVDSAGGVPALLLCFFSIRQTACLSFLLTAEESMEMYLTIGFAAIFYVAAPVFSQSVCLSTCFMLHRLLVYFPQGLFCLSIPNPFRQQFVLL